MQEENQLEEAIDNEDEISQPENETDTDVDEGSGEEAADETPDEEEAEVTPPKKKGKSRNARLRAQMENMRQELNTTKAQMAAFMQMKHPSGQTADPSSGSGNAAQSSDWQQALHQQTLIQNVNEYERKINEIRQEDEEVDDLLSNPNNPFRQFPEETINLIRSGIVKLPPDRLFKIAKAFPKEVRKAAYLDNPYSQAERLIRLDQQLMDQHQTNVNRMQKAPEPTGVLKGGSANITTELSPTDEIAKLRQQQYGGMKR